jgi:hypothetical protein
MEYNLKNQEFWCWALKSIVRFGRSMSGEIPARDVELLFSAAPGP